MQATTKLDAMSDNYRRRKQRELFLLERFIVALKLRVEVIEEREEPDFILKIDGQPVGLELTELFISHGENGNTMQAQESISSRILASAQRLYESSNAPPAHVSVCFGPGHDLRKLKRDKTAMALATFVQRLNLGVGQSLDWHPEKLKYSLPYELSFIHALGVPSYKMARWGVARAGWVAPLQTSSLQYRIDEKTKLLVAYRESIAENWLLIVSDATKPSQLIRAKESFEPHSIKSPFTRTFFYSYPDDVIIELGTLSSKIIINNPIKRAV